MGSEYLRLRRQHERVLEPDLHHRGRALGKLVGAEEEVGTANGPASFLHPRRAGVAGAEPRHRLRIRIEQRPRRHSNEGGAVGFVMGVQPPARTDCVVVIAGPEEHEPVQVLDQVAKLPSVQQLGVGGEERSLILEDNLAAVDRNRRRFSPTNAEQVFTARLGQERRGLV